MPKQCSTPGCHSSAIVRGTDLCLHCYQKQKDKESGSKTKKQKKSVIRPIINYTLYDLLIGIDCGVETGFALYNRKTKELLRVSTMKIHQAMKEISHQFALNGQSLMVCFEDARLRTWFGDSGKEKLQGAGSIKRDSKIWEDFLSDMNIPFEMIPPKENTTKLEEEYFKSLTGYKKRTSNHARDAAMLVFGK